jgi:hypothetical protein
LSIKLPRKFTDNLGSNEVVLQALKSFSIFAKPNYLILTNMRLIFFDERWVGYELKSMPFQKILEVRAERGIFFWGSVFVTSEEVVKGSEDLKTELGAGIRPQPHVTYAIRRVSKRLVEPFLDGMANVVNQIAVEPVSIRKKAGWFGKASWQYEKPEEFVTRSQPMPSQAAGQVDPLVSLKLAFAKGDISEEEYRRRLAVLRES